MRRREPIAGGGKYICRTATISDLREHSTSLDRHTCPTAQRLPAVVPGRFVIMMGSCATVGSNEKNCYYFDMQIIFRRGTENVWHNECERKCATKLKGKLHSEKR